MPAYLGGFHEVFAGEEIDRCPWALVNCPESAKATAEQVGAANALWRYLAAWRLYRAGGALPNAGGANQQDARMMEAFAIFAQHDNGDKSEIVSYLKLLCETQGVKWR